MKIEIDDLLAKYLNDIATHYGRTIEDSVQLLLSRRLVRRLVLENVFPGDPEKYRFDELLLKDKEGNFLKGEKLFQALMMIEQKELTEINALKGAVDDILLTHISSGKC